MGKAEVVLQKKLSSPTNLTFEGGVAKWDKVENAKDYSVQLYKDGKKIGEGILEDDLAVCTLLLKLRRDAEGQLQHALGHDGHVGADACKAAHAAHLGHHAAVGYNLQVNVEGVCKLVCNAAVLGVELCDGVCILIGQITHE